MAYFRLHIDCYLVCGRNGCAVYDVNGRRILLPDREAAAVLLACESRKPLRKEWLQGRVHRFLGTLVREGLGFFHSHPVHVDKMVLSTPMDDGGGLLMPPTEYTAISWSITDRCDHDCGFCPSAFRHPTWMACRSCVRRADRADQAAACSGDGALVRQMAGLGIRRLHIRGGNPLLEWERLEGVLSEAGKHPGLQVTITTPGTGQPVERLLELSRRPGVSLNLVLAGGPLLSEQESRLDVLRQGGATFSVVVLVSDDHPVDLPAETRRIVERFGTRPAFAEFHAMPDGKNAFQFRHVRKDSKQLYLWQNARQFFHMTRRNACIYGGLEIAPDGSISPCVACDHGCGKIRNGDLVAALKGPMLYDVWKMNKDRVLTCKDCAMRFACIDCLAAELMGDGHAPVARGYCPVMDAEDLYSEVDRLSHQGFLRLLSVAKGVHDP